MEEKQQSTIGKYRDVTGGFSNTELRAGSWYLRHKVLVRHIVIGVLGTWAVVSLLVSVGSWGYYAVFGYFEDRDGLVRRILSAQDYDATNSAIRAIEVAPSAIETFRSGPGKIDFVGRIQNPNERWLAEVTYHVAYGDGETGRYLTVVLPGREQLFGAFGAPIAGFPSGVQLIIDEVRYRKISAHLVPDVAGFINDRLQFPISNFAVVNPGDNFGIDDVDHPVVSFDIRNNTAYSYWQPMFIVALQDGGQVVGYASFAIKGLRSGETKTVSFTYFGDARSITSVSVLPILNIFDEDEYIDLDLDRI